MKFEIKILV